MYLCRENAIADAHVRSSTPESRRSAVKLFNRYIIQSGSPRSVQEVNRACGGYEGYYEWYVIHQLTSGAS